MARYPLQAGPHALIQLSAGQSARVAAAKVGLTPMQAYGLELRVEARVRMLRVAYPSDELVTNCIASALQEVQGMGP